MRTVWIAVALLALALVVVGAVRLLTLEPEAPPPAAVPTPEVPPAVQLPDEFKDLARPQTAAGKQDETPPPPPPPDHDPAWEDPDLTIPDAKSEDIVLEPVKDDDWGYTIDLPKGTEISQKGSIGHTYRHVMEDGIHWFSVYLTEADVSSLEKVLEQATTDRISKVDETREIEGGWLVVKKPPEEPQPDRFMHVWAFKKGKKDLGVKCSGPTAVKDRLIEMCTSVRF